MAAKKKPGKQRKPANPQTPTRPLTDKQLLFVAEYLVDLNGAAAAVRAGYSPKAARYTARDLLANPLIAKAIEDGKAERIERTKITADDVVHHFMGIATADPRELIELQRGCCRYCYGKDNLFQRTRREFDEDRHAHDVTHAEHLADPKKPNPGTFQEKGGIGWDPRKQANQKCPECFGEGDVRIVPKDTRNLSAAAARLYAGVKQTQHGLEIKMHDQQAALVNLGRHLGLFKEVHEHQGKGGGPIQHTLDEIINGVAGADTGIGKATGRA